MAEADAREQGETHGPMEDDLERAFDRQVEEGAQLLGRPWRIVLVTGFMGGAEVGIGVMAMIAVLHETGSHLLAGLAFGIGPLALLLGRSDLFTETFLVPVVAVAAKEAKPWQLGRLWGGTLVANLIGGWAVMWLVVTALPDYHPTLIESGEHFAGAALNAETFCLALLGGGIITLLTRMQHGTDNINAKIVAAFSIGFLLAGLQLVHAVLDSLLIFGALHTGQASVTYADWIVWLGFTLVGNLVGGLGLVTVLRLIRSADKLDEAREGKE